MSDKRKKRYYWLKLKEDFFEEDTIQWLEEQENGKEYSLIYLKLCLKSLKTDGFLARHVGEMLIPYDEKAIAKMTNSRIDTVLIAMNVFKEIGLIDVLENGELYMTQLSEMVGSETESAVQKRLERSKKKQVATLSHDCRENVAQSKRKSLEKELDIELEEEQKNTSSVSLEQFNLHQIIQKEFNRSLSPIEHQTIDYWRDDYNQELILEALKTAVLNNVFNLRYVERILMDWERNKLTTIKAVKEYNEKFEKRKSKGTHSKPIKIIESEPDWVGQDIVETPATAEEQEFFAKQLADLRNKKL